MIPTFSPDALTVPPDYQSEGGSDWASTIHRSAVERLAALESPSADMEEWRYSKIDKLDIGRFAVRSSGRSADAPLAQELAQRWASRIGEWTVLVVFIDGWLASVEVAPEAPVSVTTGRDVALAGGLAQSFESSVDEDYFAVLNSAIFDPCVIDIADEVELASPILVIDHVSAPGSLSGSFLGLTLGRGAAASLVEVRSSAAVDALSVPRTHVSVGSHATLDQDVVIDTEGAVWNLGRCQTDVADHARLRCAVAVTGGLVSRLRYDCALVGVGGRGDLSAVYLGDADRSVDLRTFQQHDAPATHSELSFAGAVDDESHAIYTGMIRIHPGAPKTEAHQRNRILKLSDRSWAESVPNLEILNNDVICSHASAVGPIDEDQRFYLESRGVDPDTAERLVVSGFLSSQSQAFSNPGVAEYVTARVDEGVQQ